GIRDFHVTGVQTCALPIYAISRLVHQRFPEVVLGTGRVQAWAVGSGVDPADGERAEEVRDAVSRALADGLPAVLDAGSLALAPRSEERRVGKGGGDRSGSG